MPGSKPTLQVAYVLVSEGVDRHSRMAWLSAASLRRQQPDAKIIFVVDTPTAATASTLEAFCKPVADEIIFKTADSSSPVARSRLHRIRLREYLDGDFLYVDSDTIVVRPIDGLGAFPRDLGAAMDFNYSPERKWCPPDMAEPFRELGWTFPVLPYVNAGIALMRDTPAVSAFCEEWLRRFLASSLKPHVWDQVAFNSTIQATGIPFAVLPDGYNAQVVMQNYDRKEAKILHFYGSPVEQQGTLMEHLLNHLESTGEFDDAAYRFAVEGQHPWGPHPEAWQFMRSRHYVRAAVAKGRSIVGLHARRRSRSVG